MLYLENLAIGAPTLLAQFGAAAGLLILAVVIYERVTPYREVRLIRDGNVAAAIALSGFIIGTGVALGSTLEHSVSAVDVIVWGVLTVLLQFVSYFAVAITHREFSAAIIGGNVAAALFLAACHSAAGLLVAAAVSA